MLALLAAAATDGWQPGEYDLGQALLHPPRETRPSTCAAAGWLQSPAGKTFARWLRDGGLPDPTVVALTVERQLCPTHRSGEDNCWCLQKPPLRRTVAIEAFPHPPLTAPAGLLWLPATDTYDRAYGYWTEYGTMAYWPMTLPGHRGLVVPHMLPA